MRKFFIFFVVQFFGLSMVLAQETSTANIANDSGKFIFLPVDSLNSEAKYNTEELLRKYQELLKTQKGRELVSKTVGLASTAVASGIGFGDIRNTASDSYSLECFRCAVGQDEYVNQIDCKREHHVWNVKSAKEAKSACK